MFSLSHLIKNGSKTLLFNNNYNYFQTKSLKLVIRKMTYTFYDYKTLNFFFLKVI